MTKSSHYFFPAKVPAKSHSQRITFGRCNRCNILLYPWGDYLYIFCLFVCEKVICFCEVLFIHRYQVCKFLNEFLKYLKTQGVHVNSLGAYWKPRGNPLRRICFQCNSTATTREMTFMIQQSCSCSGPWNGTEGCQVTLEKKHYFCFIAVCWSHKNLISVSPSILECSLVTLDGKVIEGAPEQTGWTTLLWKVLKNHAYVTRLWSRVRCWRP